MSETIEIHFELLLSDSDVIRNISQTDNKCLRDGPLRVIAANMCVRYASKQWTILRMREIERLKIDKRCMIYIVQISVT